MARKKITVIGAGFVGASAAAYASAQELGDVILVDILEGPTQGRALDMYEATPVHGVDTKVIGTNNYETVTIDGKEIEGTENSDVIIITAGIPRKPGMSREDLQATNVEIVAKVSEQAAQLSPKAIMIIVSNPLDAMVYTAWKKSGFHHQRIVGMAGVLDTARFRSFLAEELGVSVEDIQALVLGGHGDAMVPITRLCTVGGVPVTQLIGPNRLEEIVKRTRKGGGEIVGLLKTGSAYYAPASSAVQMAKSILLDKKRVLPCAAYLEKEFAGVQGIFIGVPAVLGAEGVERVLDLELTDDEQADFRKSADEVEKLVAEVEAILLI